MLPSVAQIIAAAETCNLGCTSHTDLLMNPDCTPKLGQYDLLYRSKSPADKSGRE